MTGEPARISTPTTVEVHLEELREVNRLPAPGMTHTSYSLR